MWSRESPYTLLLDQKKKKKKLQDLNPQSPTGMAGMYKTYIQNLRIHEHSIQCGISTLIWTAGNWKFLSLLVSQRHGEV